MVAFTITDPASLIENCTLDITVQNVYDLNGNKQESPISWSAFVRMNQMQWEEPEVNIEKEVFKAKTFTASITNSGGEQQEFSIENLPLWLEAEPQSGEIEPLSSKTITFTVNEALNTGYYAQELYLHTNFGLDEKLPLNLRVYAPEPDWTVDASQFQYSMNLIAMLKIDGVLSNDKYDKVAAFIDGECRGVSYLKYVKDYDMYELYLDIYSNKATGQKVELKVWDASAGQIYSNVTPEYTFVSNSVYGKPSSPVILEVSNVLERTIEFADGWNWISFNLQSDMMNSSQAAFASLNPTNGNLIKGADGYDMYGVNTGWFGTLTQNKGFESSKMYKLKISPAQSYTYSGTPVASDTKISLNSGWNWIGYIPQTNMTVTDALSNFAPSDGDILKSQTAFAMYDVSMGWVGSLTYMQPGEGYMLKSTNTTNFIYPQKGLFKNSELKNSNLTLANKVLKTDSNVNWTVNSAEYQYSMNITGVVSINNVESIDENDIVGAFVGNECRGLSQLTYCEAAKRYYALILVYSNKGSNDTVTFRVYNADADEILLVSQNIDFEADKSIGTFNSPYVFSCKATGVSEIDKNKLDVSVYPNPSDGKFVLSIENNTSSKALLLEIMDITGKIAYKKMINVGTKIVRIDMAHLPRGIYDLRVYNRSLSTNKKIILK